MELTKNPKRLIEIVVEMIDLDMDSQDIELAASSKVTQRNNLPIEQRFDQFQLQWYNDLIDNVCDAIENYAGFNIVSEYQSTDSYSYYIEFEAFNKAGDSLGDFTIKFRISDHIEKHGQKSRNSSVNNQLSKGKKTIFRSILVNGMSHSGIADVLNTVWHVCDELLEGNLDVLDELSR